MKTLRLITMFLCASCLSYAQEFKELSTPPSDSTILYIYRERKGANALISPGIEINGEERFLLKNAGYSYFKLDSGQYTVSIKLSDRYDGTSKIDLNLKGGQSYFVRMSTRNDSFGMMTVRVFDLELIEHDVAITGISSCKYIDPSKSRKLKKSILVDN